ncbi:MAG: TetR/AcrR family transcriptional regulator C-terminal domain-containing protein, partial [Betaproteobacteria bacterium]|nr:TetR/AcrR family transcriptional regulator C-terminal domain-containing protein [Betaproteobacteria bacterium]
MLGALVRPDALAVQRLLAADLKRDAELKADLMAASRIMLLDPLVLLIEQGVGDGEFVVPDVPWAAGAILRLVVSEVISGCEFEEFLDSAEVRAEKAARIAALVLNGLLARPG